MATDRSSPSPWSGRPRAILVGLGLGALVANLLLSSRAFAQTAVVVGVVRDSLGAEIAGAELIVDGSTARAVSDARGVFRLAGLPVGGVTLSVRRLGYRPTQLAVSAGPGGASIDVRLMPIPQTMPVVSIRERPEPFEPRLAGFNDRLARRVGHFITREQIEMRRTTTFTDLLRSVPGVRITPIGSIRNAVRIRAARCAPLVFIDGAPASAGEFDLDMIDPVSVEGIEVYSGMTTVPSEFIGARGLERCGVVAVWSRPMRPTPRVERRRSEPTVDLGSLVTRGEVYTAEQVDRTATLNGDLGAKYPDSLWNERVPGRVVAEFVVDTAGAVEMATFGTVSSSHVLFVDAVRDALGRARFKPALLGGRPVRQVVQLPVGFSLDGTRERRPPPEGPAAIP